MNRSLKINFEQKHLLIKDGGNVILVDTGSPVTIHTSNKFEFGGKEYAVTTNAMGNTIEKLQAMAGIKFTTLMGVDILSEYKVIFDYANEEITFCSYDEPTPCGEECHLNVHMGALIIPIIIQNCPHPMILDTGATCSYIKSSLTQGLRPKDTITDFSPLVGGQFTTPIYDIESELGDKPFVCTYGNLPKQIEMMIGLLGVDGVIGYDLLRSFKLMINIRDHKMLLLTESI